MPAATATKAKESHVESIPWETREEARRGRFLRSWLMLVTQPSTFYRRMALRGGLAEPVSFLMVCTGLAFAVTLIQFLLLYLIVARPEHWFFSWFPGTGSTLAFVLNTACVFVLLTPLFALVCAVDCLIFGAVSRLTGGAGERGAGVEAYFSVFAYATGPLLLTLVVGLGWAVGIVWWLILSYLGLRSAVGLSPGRTLAAIIVPLILYGILVTLGILIL